MTKSSHQLTTLQLLRTIWGRLPAVPDVLPTHSKNGRNAKATASRPRPVDADAQAAPPESGSRLSENEISVLDR